MNVEDLLKTTDPDNEIQKEMVARINEVVYGKPAMFVTLVLLNYLADFLHQLTQDDAESRIYIAELITNFSIHINANLEAPVKPENETEH